MSERNYRLAETLITGSVFRVNWEEQYGELEASTDENLTIWDGGWWNTDRHVYLYSGLIGLMTIFVISRSFAFYQMCLRVSMTLHDMIFEGVSRARMLFFHQNASGRILNRFSKDIGSIDSQLPVIVVDCIEVSL